MVNEMLRVKFILFLTFAVVVTLSHGDEQLNYNDQDGWGGVCSTGESQSPIDLPAPSSGILVPKTIPFLVLPRHTFGMTNENNLNTVKYEISPDGEEARVPWLANRWITLQQLHLHWGETDSRGSEHLVQGEEYSAEMHLVTSYTDMDGRTKYMVFARIFELGEANPEIDQMINNNNKKKDLDRHINVFDLSELYPADTDAWLTYDGGLTTPPCSEIVHWVIVRKPLTISTHQLKQLRNMQLGSGDTAALTRNWRDTQDLNGRFSAEYVRVQEPLDIDMNEGSMMMK